MPSDITYKRLLRWLVAGTLAAIAVFVSPESKEAFRLPKELLFHILTFAGVAVYASGFLTHAWTSVSGRQYKIGWLIAAILGWTSITTLTSTNIALSRFALLHAFLAAAFFWIALHSASAEKATLPLATVVGVGVVNAIAAILQKHRIWSPIPVERLGDRELVIGFLGNPNDLAGFLVPCALVSLAAVFVVGGMTRWASLLGFASASYAITVAESTTALASLIVGVATLLALGLGVKIPRRRAIGLLAVFLILLAIPFFTSEEAHLKDKLRRLEKKSAVAFLDVRLVAYATAWILAREHPLFGIGPGTFSWHYTRTVSKARCEFPTLPSPDGPDQVFGEVHNDYLEIGSETGVLGLGLGLLGMAGFLTLTSARRNHEGSSKPERISILAAWPIAASLAIQMATNFPLQITAILAIYLYIGAHLLAWREYVTH